MAVSKRLRYEILRRDNHACRYCGGVAPDVVLTVDHVTPTALGGSDAPENLVAACRDCNSGKTSVSPDAPLVADVSQKAVEWGAAIARWNALQATRRIDRDDYVEVFDQAWHRWRHGAADDRKAVPRPPDWEVTIWQFFETGLPVEELEDAVKVACGNSKLKLESIFRYMCGVVWRKVEQMHTGARDLVGEPDSDEADAEEQEVERAWFEHQMEIHHQAGFQQAMDHLEFADIATRVYLWRHVDGLRAKTDHYNPPRGAVA